ncbi:MAG: nonstructural protein [Arizlama microvirus]|nr:MAG: nonstructural protein [Arizlama microvirus]
MKLKLFTCYDSKLEAYMQPFFMTTRGQALRAFTDTVNDPSSIFAKHPEDYTLFEIGEYDDQTGDISMNQAKVSLGIAIEFLKNNKPTLVSSQIAQGDC